MVETLLHFKANSYSHKIHTKGWSFGLSKIHTSKCQRITQVQFILSYCHTTFTLSIYSILKVYCTHALFETYSTMILCSTVCATWMCQLWWTCHNSYSILGQTPFFTMQGFFYAHFKTSVSIGGSVWRRQGWHQWAAPSQVLDTPSCRALVS